MSKPKNPYEKAKNIREGHLFAAWNEGYAAGLADGARRERRALKKLLTKGKYFTTPPTHVEESILDWLADRNRGGGRNDLS